MLPSTLERVAQNTDRQTNKDIRRHTDQQLQRFRGASYDQITKRIEELKHEWDIERILEFNAASLVLLSTVLGFRRNRLWFSVPGIAGVFLLQHALQGWCPPLSVLRKLGVRTSDEIHKEITSLRLLRGDLHATDDPTDAFLQSYDY